MRRGLLLIALCALWMGWSPVPVDAAGDTRASGDTLPSDTPPLFEEDAPQTTTTRTLPCEQDEVRNLRTENSRTFRIGEDTYRTDIYDRPVHRKDIYGQWQNVPAGQFPKENLRNNPVMLGEGFQATFPPDIRDTAVDILLSNDGKTLSFGLKPELHVLDENGDVVHEVDLSGERGIPSRNAIEYTSNEHDMVLRYEIIADGMKQSVILQEIPEGLSRGGSVVLREKVVLPEGTSLEIDDTLQILRIVDGEGVTMAWMPTPVAHETPDGATVHEHSVVPGSFKIIDVRGELFVETHMDANLFLASATRYPVTIDPSLIVGDSVWGWVASNGALSTGTTFVFQNDGEVLGAGYHRFDLASVPVNAGFLSVDYHQEVSLYQGAGDLEVVSMVTDPTTDPGIAVYYDILTGPALGLVGGNGAWDTPLGDAGLDAFLNGLGFGFVSFGLRPAGVENLYATAVEPATLTVVYTITDLKKGSGCANAGTACEGPDADGCSEGGQYYCTANQDENYCGDGPVGLWLFQEPQGNSAKDISGYGNDGTVINASWNVGEQAMYFNGFNARVEIPGSASLYAPHGYSVEAWIKPSHDNDYWTGVVGQKTGGKRSYQMWMGQSNSNSYGSSSFIHHAYGCPSSWSQTINSTNFTNNGSAWTHFVITMDPNGKQRVYVNGSLNNSTNSCGENTGTTSTQPVLIGRNLDGGNSNYYKGFIKEVAVFNYPIGPSDVAEHYIAGIPETQKNRELCDGKDNDCDNYIDEDFNVSEGCNSSFDSDPCTDQVVSCDPGGFSASCIDKGPATYFPLDETTGKIANDYTGNGHTGTVKNAKFNTSIKKAGASSLYFDGSNDYVQFPTAGMDDGDCVAPTWTWESEDLPFHVQGKADGEGWACNVAQHSPNHMVYGPYYQDLPFGKYDANFHMMIDSVAGNASDHIATIDVFDAAVGGVVIAQDIYRSDFNAANVYTPFPLTFKSSGSNNFEFRVYWKDKAYLNVDKVLVERTDASCNNKAGSLAVWIRPNGWHGTSYTPRGIFQTNGGINKKNSLTVFKWYNSTWYVRMGSNSGCCNNDLNFYPGSSKIANGVWTHLAVTWDSEADAIKVFINGELQASRKNVNWSSPAFNSKARWGRGYNKWFKGYMDEAATYGYALTQAEIQDMMNNGVPDANINLEVCDGIDNNCNGLTDEGSLANDACDDGDSCTYDRCNLGACVHLDPEHPGSTGPVICELSGPAGSTQTCAFQMARKNINSISATALELDISYPHAKAKLDHFSQGLFSPFVVPPANLASGHSVALSPSTANAWTGSGTILIADIAGLGTTPLTNAYYQWDTLNGDPIYMAGHFVLQQEISSSSPVQVTATKVIPADSEAAQVQFLFKDNTIVTIGTGEFTCSVLGAACDDGNPCTTDDQCINYQCVGTQIYCTDDNNACTHNFCDPNVGCVSVPAKNSCSCDDGEYCTSNDTCQSQTCIGGPPPTCDDGNPCTNGSCVIGTGCVHAPNSTVYGSCDTGILGECGGGEYQCEGGSPYCMSTVSEMGKIKTVNIPAGLLKRNTGLVGGGWQIITSNGRYLFNLAYGRNGTSYNGWTYRVFDPQDGFNMILEKKVGTSSFYMDGLVADDTYLYPIKWSGGKTSSVYRINWQTGAITTGWSVAQQQNNPGDQINGQYDWSHGKVFTGALRSATGFRYAGDPWAPWGSSPNGNWESVFTMANISGAGVVATDGTYLYVKRWASYPGDDHLRRIGTGYNGTTEGAYYGNVTSAKATKNSVAATYHSDGYVYNPMKNAYKLQRIRVNEAIFELCNALDDDCDGTSDEDFPNLGLACDGNDSDFCANGTWTCNGSGSAAHCINESITNIPEVCDYADNDCDSSTDEGYDVGAACGTGVCTGGSKECTSNGAATQCNTMPGGSIDKSSSEICDYSDNDCDASTDEGYDVGAGCGTGVCTGGSKECTSNGATTQCNTMPGGSIDKSSSEICDYSDNDCDASTDEGYDVGAGCGTGVCTGGSKECTSNGATTQCNTMPGGSIDKSSSEICDYSDNDCDASTDEGYDVGAACGTGVCAGGSKECTSSGAGTQCNTMPGGSIDKSSSEICDYSDNDCDASTDEGYDVGTACGTGVCTGGSKECTSNGATTQCNTMPGGSGDLSSSEICDYVDNDCDASTDEGYDVGAACGTGVCAGGSKECTSSGGGTQCNTMPGGSGDLSSSEICDYVDNDCDASTDEGYDVGAACGTGQCTGGSKECTSNGATTQCNTMPGGSGDLSSGEICDGIDNDCDGNVDEGFDVGAACGVGVCVGGHKECTANGAGTQCNTMPGGSIDKSSTDICDYLDNDCDASTDENYDVGANCGVGVCVGGHKECTSSGGGTQCDTMPGGSIDKSSTDNCDYLDNDCDGTTDEKYISGGSVTYTDLNGTSGLVRDNNCGVGDCAGGTVVCASNQTSLTCTTVGQASPELCNAQDDDCDGSQDEGYDIGTACGVGQCSGGAKECSADGMTTHCSSMAGGSGDQTSTDICDGVDNNCNGHVDDVYTGSSYTTRLFGTSFEGLHVYGGNYVDTLPANTAHALLSNAGQPIVNATAAGNDLGFTSYYTPKSSGPGLTDGDQVGVVNSGASFPDGAKAFSISDPDGTVTVTFDTVSLAGLTSPSISLKLFVKSTGWETSDHIIVKVATNTGTKTLLNTQGSDIDSLGLENKWTTLTQSLSGSSTATLSVALKSNANNERIYFDDIRFNASFSSGGSGGITYTDLNGTQNLVKSNGCGVGECAGGTVICAPNQTSLTCTTLGNASTDVCDYLDNDCNGVTDQSYIPGGSVTYTDLNGTGGLVRDDNCGVGACAGGTVVCASNKTTLTCTSLNQVSNEICDAVDNDCDGKTDHVGGDGADILANDLQSCENQNGVCSGATKPSYLCTSGSWDACTHTEYGNYSGSYEANTETKCDGLDNECDGDADDDFSMTLIDGSTSISGGIGEACGLGVCAGGVTHCNGAGNGIVCSTETPGNNNQVSLEICDAKDNDCDGKTDHVGGDGADILANDLQSCENQNGVCSGATKPSYLCTSGSWDACTHTEYGNYNGNYEANTETKCDGLDNECDGDADDDFSMTLMDGSTSISGGIGEACGLGVCAGGVTHCNGAGNGIVCSTETPGNNNQVSLEICDAKDNDCDGKMDHVGGDGADILANDLQSCENQNGVCSGSTKPSYLCTSGSWDACTHTEYGNFNGNYEANTETKCDGLDNECDGDADDDFSMTLMDGSTSISGGIGEACGLGVCSGGVTHCNGAGNGIVCSTETPGNNNQVSLEICDAKDNDCDGKTDHVGGDGADILANDLQSCENQNGVCSGSTKPSYLCTSGSWDACTHTEYGNYNGNYEANTETKCDGLDNECDGDVDDDFSMTLMDGSTSITGGIGEACGLGVCSGGVTHCNGAGNGIVCSTETLGNNNQVKLEICDAKDNDCDGKTDHVGGDGADILANDLQSCENQNGVCSGSTKPSYLCTSGSWDACTHTEYGNYNGNYEANTETKCDGLDNECDADIDDDFSMTLMDGSTSISGGIGEACGVGECGGGVTHCNGAGNGIVCSTETLGNNNQVAAEICNALDDDCDGKTDHVGGDGADILANDLQSCENQNGVCSGSTKPSYLCTSGSWDACTHTEYGNYNGNYEANTETKCDGLDNECDGDVDDDFSMTLMDGSTSISGGIGEGCGVGVCSGGVTHCNAGGNGIVCSTETLGNNNQVKLEICNALDDDCDGKTDHVGGDAADILANDLQSCENQNGVCSGSTKPSYLCTSGSWDACTHTEYGNYNGNYEANTETKCDGLDNECDGDVDDDFSLTLMDGSTVISGGIGEACGVGVCSGGVTHCNAGGNGIVCSTETLGNNNLVKLEICNALDDDCDGMTDHVGGDGADILTNDLQSCENQNGVCSGSTKPSYLCTSGTWDACTHTEYGNYDGNYEANTETKCDGLDNECDADIDDDFSMTLMDGSTSISGGIGEGCGVGVCSGGVTHCNAGGNGIVCSTETLGNNNQVKLEICNALDDDCDGKTDHVGGDAADILANDLQSCENQNGVCSGSTKPSYLCTSGTWDTCTHTEYGNYNGNYEANTETKCDGLDNECDADIDDDFSMTLMDGSTSISGGIGEACGVGECGGGVTHCNAGGNGIVCSTETLGNNNQVALEICDAKDNDCDGKTDHVGGDGADILANDLQSCENQNGVCVGSTKPSYLCTAGTWDTCTHTEYGAQSADYEANTETKCDGLDNECDADIDDDFSLTLMDGSTVISGGIGETCGVGECSDGTTECNVAGTGIKCSTESDGSGNVVANEICDALDNDCDGKTDHVGGDGADLLVNDLQNCENQNGVCVGSTKPSYLCTAGTWDTCTHTEYGNYSANYEAIIESKCDGLDNECDADIDDDFSMTLMDGSTIISGGIGETCGVGICSNGVTECNPSGTGIKCSTEFDGSSNLVKLEICNALDDDCDGKTDHAGGDGPDLLTNDLQICENQNGVCSGSTKPSYLCTGGTWDTCTHTEYGDYTATYEANIETKCDGLDNECDADIDDDFSMTLMDGSTSISGGIGEACGVGVCSGGVTHCNAGGNGIVCSTETLGNNNQVKLEICNSLDDDCDSKTDHVGGDGADLLINDLKNCENQNGVCSGSTKPSYLCTSGTWDTCTHTEYGDYNGNYEANTETKCDGLDNECDADIDDDFSMTLMDGSTSISGGIGEACGVGECGGGVTHCNAGGNGIVCSTETLGNNNQVALEICDAKDNDCDGKTDHVGGDGAELLINDLQNCENQNGVCVGSTKPSYLCTAGTWDACTHTEYGDQSADYEANTETKCDGLDNECDADIDDDFSMTLMDGSTVVSGGIGETCGVGVCSNGVTQCNAGGNGIVCSTETLGSNPQVANEICDAKDNDCDGLTDAADPVDVVTHDLQNCENQNGECVGSTKPAYLCTSGTWDVCTHTEYGDQAATYEANAEVSCDGLDNDCDADIDDDFTMTLLDGSTSISGGIGEICGVGECAGGTTECNAGGNGVICSTESLGSNSLVSTDICDYKDNDCDGFADEDYGYIQETGGLPRYTGDPCNGIGECGAGTVECLTQDLSICSTDQNGSEDESVPEVCDYKDNDCNGFNDNGMLYFGSPVFAECDGIGECGIGAVECHLPSGVATCSTDSNGSEDQSTSEICDYKDNDCDASSDEGFLYDAQPIYGPCDGVGFCGVGTVECLTTSVATCSTNPGGTEDESVEEFCNNIDDDCDAAIDETLEGDPLPEFCYDGPAPTLDVGICHGGTHYCYAGVWGNCIGQTLPMANDKICDGVDTDCADGADEDYEPIPCGVGACASLSTCIAGIESACVPGIPAPDDKICDAIDENCNGLEDEEYEPIYCGLGACERHSYCHPGGVEEDCVIGPPTGDDTDCDEIDDDCDGLIDEHFDDEIACTIDICIDGDDYHTKSDALCDDNQPCTDDICTATTTLDGGCIFVPDDTNTPDPALIDINPCTDLRCVSGTSLNVIDDTNIPDDSVWCTDDYCDIGQEYHPTSAGTCRIDTVCYSQNEVDPSDGCSVCFPDDSQSQWSNTVFEEYFDSGTLGQMTTTTETGTLQWTSATNRFVTPGHSVRFANPVTNNYNTGSEVQGSMTTPVIGLASDALHLLRFQLYLDTERFTAAPIYDVLFVHVLTDLNSGTPTETTIWDSTTTLGGSTLEEWKWIFVDLSAFGGQDVQVVFEFDSGDAESNNYEGAYIDDITLKTACCAVNEDCDDGDECTADICIGGGCNYTDECAPSCIPSASNVVLLVDRSASMADIAQPGEPMSKWDTLGQALDIAIYEHQKVVNIGVKAYPTDVGVSWMGCSVSAGLDVDLHATSTEVAQFLATQTPAGAGTPMAAALYSAQASLQSSIFSGYDYVILITDGGEDCGSDAIAATEALQASGIQVIVVGYGQDVDHDMLNEMALAGGRPLPAPANANPHYYPATTYEEIIDAIDAVLDLTAAEVCDGEDNDCDGEIDEDIDVLACNAHCTGGGQTACVDGGWGVCDVVPVAETCNGWDDNCNSMIDEDWIPDDNGNSLDELCSLGIGACKAWGNYICNASDVSGALICNAIPGTPTPEVCDGIDNDCDGIVDNGLAQVCSTACGVGTEICINGAWYNCDAPPVLPEICDGIDNDCDGPMDEKDNGDPLDQPCTTACGNGYEYCTAGVWHSCDAPPVLLEICDGIDNDCNGTIDLDDYLQYNQTAAEIDANPPLTQSCFDGPAEKADVGICKSGIATCIDHLWGACMDQILPEIETCNTLDDDCDALIDEDDLNIPLTVSCYTGSLETAGVGTCSDGLSYCEVGIYGECVGDITPEPEMCDGLDNDCDGAPDEDPGHVCIEVPECFNANCKCGEDALGEYKCFLD